MVINAENPSYSSLLLNLLFHAPGACSRSHDSFSKKQSFRLTGQNHLGMMRANALTEAYATTKGFLVRDQLGLAHV